MPGAFAASAASLRSAAEFLDGLTAATESTGVRIDGSFTIALSDDDTIAARWDGEQYLIEDQVGA